MAAAGSTQPEPSRRGERTRHALIAAGRKLFSEQTVDAVTIDDIVRAASVAKGSFYTHFDDKQAFASTIRRGIREEVEAAVGRVNAEINDPAVRVARAFAVYVDYILASRQRANVIVRINVGLTSTENPLNQGVLNDVAEGLRSGRFVVPSVKAGALFVIGACQIALMHAVEEPSRGGTIMIAQQLGALMFRGLGIPFAEAEGLIATALHELVA